MSLSFLLNIHKGLWKIDKYAKLTNNNRLTVLDDCDVAIVKRVIRGACD